MSPEGGFCSVASGRVLLLHVVADVRDGRGLLAQLNPATVELPESPQLLIAGRAVGIRGPSHRWNASSLVPSQISRPQSDCRCQGLRLSSPPGSTLLLFLHGWRRMSAGWHRASPLPSDLSSLLVFTAGIQTTSSWLPWTCFRKRR